jgi:hypothetical protein
MKLLDDVLRFFKPDKISGSKRAKEDEPTAAIKENVNTPDERRSLLSDGNGTFDVVVVGVSYYQEALRGIFGDTSGQDARMLVPADIIPDNDNTYDAYAVRIHIGGKLVGYLSRPNARQWRSKMISEGFSGATTCPARIAWDRRARKEGSYGVWLDIDLTLQDSKPDASYKVHAAQPGHIEFLVNQLNRFELSNCRVGDEVNLWVADDAREIVIYRQGCDFGEGKIGICSNAFFKVISSAPGSEARIASIYEGGCRIACKLISKEEMAEREKEFWAAEKKRLQELRGDLTSPVEYSSIDSDIYRCFICNKTGMCEEIGTWEQFAKVEDHIAKLCQERNGKYYKSQAKTASFAIIFAPTARTHSNVMSLKEKGFKVTTFEKALEYFTLTSMWNCERLTKAENDYKKFMCEETLGKLS